MRLKVLALIVSSLAVAQTSPRVRGLIRNLESRDALTRLTARRDLLRLGSGAIPELERAGAKPMAGIAPPLRDVVYSVLGGVKTRGCRGDVLGLHFDRAVARIDVIRMGEKHGFRLDEAQSVRSDAEPACYVKIEAGRSLNDVMRALLTSEPGVTTLNLSCPERTRRESQTGSL